MQKKKFKHYFFVGILKVKNDNNENRRIRNAHPDPDPLVRGMDLRIRIHIKMPWIRNTGCGSALVSMQIRIQGAVPTRIHKDLCPDPGRVTKGYKK
jgi:hypothetical protein